MIFTYLIKNQSTMKKIIILFCITFFQLQSANAQNQFELEGVIVPRTLDFNGNTLTLSGYGVRSKMWVDVYVQALYLTLLNQEAQEIVDGNTEMAIRIQITSSMVSSNKFSRSVNNGLERSAGKDIATLRPKIDLLISMLKDEIVKDDVFTMNYNPRDSSLWIYKNDVYKGKVEGIDFKKAFFGIWLCEKPVDQELKNNLLGKY